MGANNFGIDKFTKDCIGCGEPMAGIVDYRARERCEECGGEALNTTGEASPDELYEEAMERRRREKAEYLAGREARIEQLRNRAARWTPPKVNE